MNQPPYASTTANFTQPASGSTVTATVTSTVTMSVDQVVFVQNGGYYLVTGITDGTDVVLKNLGLAVNAASSTSIPSGSLVGGFALDLSSNTVVVGEGTAGTPAGGVLSVQGVSGGEALPVSGTVAVSNLPSTSSPSLYNNFLATSLSGTFGVTNGSSTVTTSVNQTGVLSSGSLINFASQAQTYEINTVGSSSLTLFSPATYTGTTNAATTATYPTVAQSGVIKSTSGTIFATQSFGGGVYLMLFNSSSVPSPGTVPSLVWDMGTSVGASFFTDAGLTFSNGISFGISTIEQSYVPVATPLVGHYLMVTYA